MSVQLRLRRMGANKKPFFRIIAADVRSANQGNFLEEIGWYNPTKKEGAYFLDLPRAEAWLKKGAKASDTVWSFIRACRKAAKRAPGGAGVEAPAGGAGVGAPEGGAGVEAPEGGAGATPAGE